MGFWPFGRDRETTRVGIESEITIPWQTYLVKCVCGIIFVIGLFMIGWLIWLFDFLATGTFSQWLVLWIVWFKRNWPLIPIFCISWCISVPLIMLFFRMSIEQLFKAWLPTDLYGWIFGKIKQ